MNSGTDLQLTTESAKPCGARRWYADQFQRLAQAAGLPVIRLHDARHTCGMLMHLRGGAHSVIRFSTWAAYVPSQDDALAAAGAIYGSVIRGSQSGVWNSGEHGLWNDPLDTAPTR
jgi:hypothetical protein